MAKLQAFKKGELVSEIHLTPGQEYVVGRKDGCDIVLDKLPGISRQHFKVVEMAGVWRVECLSQMKGLDVDGEESQSFDLETGKRFYLSPYSFAFFDKASQVVDENPENFSDEPQAKDLMADQAADEIEPANEAPADMAIGSEEKTDIKSFKGIPYIKISSGHGRKPEYFRLEGHLWVAGSDANAAIYLSDTHAAPAHFEISRSEKGFYITDLGSPTGTLLNGHRLSTSERTEINSGDLIAVGSLTMQFELRDQSFKEKVNNIPLHMYQNPLVFFDQDAGVLSTVPETYEMGEAEEIEGETIEDQQKKRKTYVIRFAAVVIILLLILFNIDSGDESTDKQTVQNLSAFDKLTPKEQKFVKEQYERAQNLYLNGSFELALTQIQKLHQTISDGYKDSKEIEEYCINWRDTQRQRDLLARQKAEQEAQRRRIQESIINCSNMYRTSIDLAGARTCLSEAIQMDPGNPEIQEILANIEARIEQKAIAEKLAQEAEEKARRGKNLYLKAKALHKAKQYIKAMEAYENHIYAGLPDPEGLVTESKRNLASIEKYINQKKGRLMWSARDRFKSANLKEAISLARKAQKVDPHDYTISYFLHKAEKELTNKMKNLYMDSVIEERFGNLDASRAKWNEIIQQDIEDGEYYQKAKRKIKQYGI